MHGGEVNDTLSNLDEAIETEEYEWSDMYMNFANDAKKEGFSDIAHLFELTAAIERSHERIYKSFVKNIKHDCVFEKPDEIVWKCGNCGNLHYSKTAPETCPMCDHPQSYYRKLDESYK